MARDNKKHEGTEGRYLNMPVMSWSESPSLLSCTLLQHQKSEITLPRNKEHGYGNTVKLLGFSFSTFSPSLL